MNKSIVYLLSFILLSACGSSKTSLNNSSGSVLGSAECGGMNPTACETFRLVNIERVKNSLAALSIFGRCVEMAQEQSQDMNDRHYFSHERPDETYVQRVGRFNVGYTGENIAGNSSPAGATRNWMASTGHRANILNPNFKGSGVGYVNGLYTQCFTAYQ